MLSELAMRRPSPVTTILRWGLVEYFLWSLGKLISKFYCYEKNIKISLIFPSMLNYLININNCRRVKLCKQWNGTKGRTSSTDISPEIIRSRNSFLFSHNYTSMWVLPGLRFSVIRKSPSLQQSRCDSRSVVLTDVHADMSGYYTCEVTTQKTFETVQARQYLLVVREYQYQGQSEIFQQTAPSSGMLVRVHGQSRILTISELKI